MLFLLFLKLLCGFTTNPHFSLLIVGFPFDVIHIEQNFLFQFSFFFLILNVPWLPFSLFMFFPYSAIKINVPHLKIQYGLSASSGRPFKTKIRNKIGL